MSIWNEIFDKNVSEGLSEIEKDLSGKGINEICSLGF